MVLKKITPASEHAFSVVEHAPQVPKEFWIELDNFVNRNTIAETSDRNGKTKHYCMHCLKAHALKIAQQRGLKNGEMKLIGRLFEKNHLGHEGYYIDGENIIKI